MQNSSTKPKSDLLRLSVTLLVIAGVMALLVSLVNYITAPVIKQRNEQKITEGLTAVIPDADSFQTVSVDIDKVTSADGKEVAVDGVWNAYKDEEIVGVCIKVSPKGYGGAIETIVAVSETGEILNTKIVSMSETSGIGTKIQDDSFLSRFIGIKNTDGVSTISGATKSSKAYLRGINAALSIAEKVIGGND